MPSGARVQVPDLEEKVDFLSAPTSYAEHPRSVEARETHMSWVFLTDRHAFKLKKPVKTSFLDFSTLERRLCHCEEEVRLNESLAPGVYLGVVPLGIDRSGKLRLGEGEPVDYLVHMARLPAEATLEAKILAGRFEEADIRVLATRLTDFYRVATAIGITPAAYRTRLSAEIAASAEALRQTSYGLPVAAIEDVACALQAFTGSRGELLERRADERRIVDAHGDLRPEHVYFLRDRVAVIDRIEFNAVFRQLDPAEELAYLAMECDRLKAPSVGPWLFDAYGTLTGDRPAPELIEFYKCARAMLRAKLAIWHLDSPRPRTPEKWPRQAKAYLGLAGAYATGL